MSAVALPPHALLASYAADGGYADCYVTELPRAVSQAEYVAAFYTTWLFKLERVIIARLAKLPSTDAEAHELARGAREQFAAWRVAARADDQLLMRDFQTRRTCSWFMTERTAAGTRLYFGSGIVPRVDAVTGAKRMGPGFRALLGFHQLYSRALLAAARGRLKRPVAG